MLLLILPLLVSASQRPLPPGFEEASWKKVGFKIVADVKKFMKNIAKGTTDPRVEFISQVLKQISIKSNFKISIISNFKIFIKH